MRLTPDFHDYEVVSSGDHPELVVPFGFLPPYVAANSMWVLLDFMQPARDLAGRLDVLSFVRSAELNAVTPGASPTSSHPLGLACDFRPARISSAAFWEMARNGELAAAGADWDKLNMYTNFSPASFHVGFRSVGQGAGRRRLFVDWNEL